MYFPNRGCAASLLRPTINGDAIEVGVCGSEGFFSIRSYLHPGPETTHAVVQAEGSLCVIEAGALRAACLRAPALQAALSTYVNSFADQLTQQAVCNRLHSLVQRLTRWLLVMRDRIGSNDVRMTHEFLARMLGVRRASVTVSIAALERDGLIWRRRGVVSIRDAARLQRLSCECYPVLHSGFMEVVTHGRQRLR